MLKVRYGLVVIVLGSLTVLSGCGGQGRSLLAPSPTTVRHAPLSLVPAVIECDGDVCTNCDAAFNICVFCDPEDVNCPGDENPYLVYNPDILLVAQVGPACPQFATIGGTFDGVSTNATYTVPYFARLGWSIVAAPHNDQYDVDFYLAGGYVGGRGSGRINESAMSGYQTFVPPSNGPFDSTQATGSWHDVSASALAGVQDLSFTAAGSSFC